MAAGSDSGYDLSEISNLFFARYSLFFAGLNNFRNFILNKTAPSYAETLRSFTGVTLPPLSDADVLAGIEGLASRVCSRCAPTTTPAATSCYHQASGRP